jgi:N6-L-threonylcarbamoyladenine synthase
VDGQGPMKILAIETSCDETAVAVLECTGDEKAAHFKILGDALLSQIELHQPYGGVFPTLAKREHQKNLPVMLEQALVQAQLAVQDVDAIAVTAGLNPRSGSASSLLKNLRVSIKNRSSPSTTWRGIFSLRLRVGALMTPLR